MSTGSRGNRLGWVLVAALAAVLGARGFLLPYSVEREVWWLKSSGYLALGALFLSLSMTPLARLQPLLGVEGFSRSSLMALRRRFGIAAALFGALHGGLALTTYLEGSWRVAFASPYLRAGVASLAILLALLATSFPRLTGRLRVRLWRELHRLIYVAAFFLAQHLLLSPFAPRGRSLLLSALLLLLLGLRVLPRRAG